MSSLFSSGREATDFNLKNRYRCRISINFSSQIAEAVAAY